MRDEVLIKAENVSKKFCRDFKRSLWYGMKDIGRSLLGQDHSQDELRKDEFWAVKDINFEIRRGECLGLIGHNGAGKSTLLKMLNGLINPDQGKITMRGRVGALIELGAGFNPVLTGRENIYNNGAVLGFSRKEINEKYDAIVEFSEIGEFIDAPVQNYSSGMKVRLGFAVAAQMEPDVLLIDEVLAVGDIGFRFKCFNAIGDILKNSAVIFVSHTMPQVYRICNQILLMDSGNSIYKNFDVGKGIELYYNTFKNNKQQIAGTGDVELLYFNALSGQKEASIGGSLTIKHGESVKFNIGFEMNKKIDQTRIQCVIWNQELLPVLDIVNIDLEGLYIIQNENGKHHVSVEIPALNLASGKHSVSFIANSDNVSQNYCRHDNAIRLTVAANSTSGAHVILPSKWVIENIANK